MTKTRRLSDLTTALRGRVAANTTTEPNGPRLFGLAEITDHASRAPRYIDADANPSDLVALEDGDVVIALLGNIGRAALIDAATAGTILARECVALRITAPEALRPPWLHQWTRSHEFTSQVAQHVTGATMPRLTIRALEGFTITPPPVTEQLAIEALANHFSEAIAATASTLRQLEDLRDAELQLALSKR